MGQALMSVAITVLKKKSATIKKYTYNLNSIKSWHFKHHDIAIQYLNGKC